MKSLTKWIADGTPWVWLNAAAVSASILLVVGLLLLIGVRGMGHFWPLAVQEIVYTEADGIWPALCEAVLRLKVQWPRDNVLQLPLAASVGWDKRTDKLGHEIEKRNERDALLAPAVGLEPTTKRLTVARSTN